MHNLYRKSFFPSCLLVSSLWTPPSPASASEPPTPNAAMQPAEEAPASQAIRNHRLVLVEDYTGHTLLSGEIKIGTDLEAGLSNSLMVGTDLISTTVGAPTLRFKYQLYRQPLHQLAFGLRAAYLSRHTVWWGNISEHFSTLKAQVLRPALSWTYLISPRLKLHTYWAISTGRLDAELSETGRRRLWETKHPGGSYDDRSKGEQVEELPEGAGNQEIKSSQPSNWAMRTVQVQSISGIMSDLFQISGEIIRKGQQKVIVSTRAEQSNIEKLKANTFRITVAQQWIRGNFQIRMGFGFSYVAITGRDLDGEKIDVAGVIPASDVVFYWRL